jgi:capsular exopolysaccharide synthesis family protein
MEIILNDQSFISEQFRTLKVRIHQYAINHPIKVLVISSPQPEDGKSLISCNLAASFSKDLDRKVILIDCDLRNPTIHHYFGITVGPGLLNYLESDNMQPYCFMRRLDRLYLMTAGGYAVNPVELLTTEKMQQFVDHLKGEFDTIILDAPPFTPISDAQIVTGLADGFVLVARSGKTTFTNMERAFRSLDRNKLIGVVFNDVQPRMFHTLYDYRYYGKKGQQYYRSPADRSRPAQGKNNLPPPSNANKKQPKR